MNDTEGYNTYKLFLALNRHFSSNYDFHKYRGNIKASINAFNNRKDRWMFVKLERDYPDRNDLIQFLVTVFTINPRETITSVVKHKSKYYNAQHKQRKIIVDNISDEFKRDLSIMYKYIDSKKMMITDFLFGKDEFDQYYIVSAVRDGLIKKETFIILDDLTNFGNRLKLDIDFIFKDEYAVINKYKNFILKGMNKDELKKIFMIKFKH